MQHKIDVAPVAVADIIPYARNARTHSEEQVEQIAASIREFGFNVPVLLDDKGEIVAGHGRVLAAHVLGLQEVPAIRLGHLSEAQAKAFRLADNRIALSAKWDEAMLGAELADLRGLGVDLGLIGFTDTELNKLLTGDGSGDDADEVPEVPTDAVSRPGDVWEMGGHRIICGDCTSAEAVAALLGKDKPVLMVTDPPYGVAYDPMWRVTTKGPDGQRLSKANTSVGVVANDDRADWTEAWALFPGNTVYIWHGGLHCGTVLASLEAAGFAARAQIIWVKQLAPISRGDYHWRHEPCWYAVRKGKPGGWHGDRKQNTVWEINTAAGWAPKDDTVTFHGTQKPVECMRRPIVNSSMPGDFIYEPFSGSGTTIIAAEATGRRCLAMELMPVYVDVAVLRWQAYAKGEARLAGDGRTFAEIAEERKATVFG